MAKGSGTSEQHGSWVSTCKPSPADPGAMSVDVRTMESKRSSLRTAVGANGRWMGCREKPNLRADESETMIVTS
ncbi:hypothetical protein DAEQUDRAFT_729364 [Daedalea quercina L-15889]|uniref:Uncharacterized protein n=1 Tax=Daedalea quercina L-15889 TaxID=1314783 RepID=A0A165NM77_9APHY|nr:hypothetical protein DAEQUDRAFT_729364 [Daedalea quercina L-15889]